MERLERPEKNWKFSASDLAERERWNDYMEVYEDAINATSTEWAPWYIIPADNKWATRALVADIITTTLRDLDLKFPEVTQAQLEMLDEARKTLEDE
jgi:polyphosphate kinase 2 (PPK2 family)